jgi:hypothetical protein
MRRSFYQTPTQRELIDLVYRRQCISALRPMPAAGHRVDDMPTERRGLLLEEHVKRIP